MKLFFKNPYEINKNLFIIFFIFLKKKSNIYFISYFKYICLTIFKRFIFELIRKNKALYVEGRFKNKKFKVNSFNSQLQSIYLENNKKCYEPDVYAVISSFLPNNGTFVDVGSNWGHHTFIAALEKNSTVFSFEPNKYIYKDLKRIKSELGCNKVNLFNIALGEKTGSIELTQLGFESGTASTSDNFLSQRKIVNRFEILVNKISFYKPLIQKVNIHKIDNVIPSHMSVDLIKVDIEGAELNFLKGASNLIQRTKAKILFELHTDEKNNLNEFKDFFKNFDYDLYIVQTDVPKNIFTLREALKLKPNQHYNILASHQNLKSFT